MAVQTILVADIGGTNCRLGFFKLQKNKLVMERAAWVETGSIATTESLMLAMGRELDVKPEDASAVVVAIAGPVENLTSGRLSNGNLMIDFAPLNKKVHRYYLLNDFIAQAYAVLSPVGENSKHIAGPQKSAHDGVRAVIGAGTGLGQARLIQLNSNMLEKTAQWLALPSENGHSVFPFANGAENDLHTFIRTKLNIPYATGDIAIAGRGLALLHEFLTGDKLTPAQVGGQFLSSDTHTLKWYSRLYARACRNWMLDTMCEGGLWIAGGIAAQNPLVITNQYFKDELYNVPYKSKQWYDFISGIPVFLIEDTNSGLWGAARFGQQEVELNLPREETVEINTDVPVAEVSGASHVSNTDPTHHIAAQNTKTSGNTANK